MKIRTITLLLLSAVFVLFGCKKDPMVNGGPSEGVLTTATFNFSVAGSGATKSDGAAGVDSEYKLDGGMTMYVFHQVTGKFEMEKFLATAVGENSIDITTGAKTLVAAASTQAFVANKEFEDFNTLTDSRPGVAISALFTDIATENQFLMVGEVDQQIVDDADNAVAVTVGRVGAKVSLAYNPIDGETGAIGDATTGTTAKWMLAQVNKVSYLFDQNTPSSTTAPLTPAYGGTSLAQAADIAARVAANLLPESDDTDKAAKLVAIRTAYTSKHLTAIPTTVAFGAASAANTDYLTRAITTSKAASSDAILAYAKSLYAPENINYAALNGNSTYVIVEVKIIPDPNEIKGTGSTANPNDFVVGLDDKGVWDKVFYKTVVDANTINTGTAYASTPLYVHGMNYYRVNLYDDKFTTAASESHFSVRRNFLYKINISKVSGLGAPTTDPEDGGETPVVPSIGITATVTVAPWQVRIMDTIL